MTNSTIQQTIGGYISSYNSFDVEGMVAQLHPDVEFENIADGDVTLRIKGIGAFRKQAEEARKYFSQREQKVTQLTITGNIAEAQINYTALLAIDLPNGTKAGDKLELKGKSVFTFKDGKIIRLQDYS